MEAIPAEKAVTSALAIVPPLGLCAQIEEVRKEHDKAFERWPPHINILFPFIPEAHMELAVPLVEKALCSVAPFTVTFNELDYFKHPKSVLLYAKPTESRPGAFRELHAALGCVFPWCNDTSTKSVEGFTPHLTLGQFESLTAAEAFVQGLKWKPFSFCVDHVSFLARSDATGGRFVEKHVVKLVAKQESSLIDRKIPAESYSLGELGHLVTIPVPSADTLIAAGVSVSKKKPLVVAIVDRSGSMGQWTSVVINESLPAALTELGYPPDERVVVITFDSITERVRSPVDSTRDPTLKELGKIPAACRGSTSMSPVVKILTDVLDEVANDAVSIMVVSDGAVDDKEKTVKAAESAASAIKGRTAPISVSLFQLLSSTYADPDTRAMSCIGSLNTAGKVSITEVPTSSSNSKLLKQDAVNGITQSFVKSLSASAAESISITCPSAALHRLPGDQPMSQLAAIAGRTITIIVDPSANLSDLRCAGLQLDLTSHGDVKDESSIAAFLQFVESQMRVWAVMGARKDDTAAILTWLRKLQALLEPVVESAQVSYRVCDRARDLVAVIHKRKKSFLSRMLQLGNLEKLSQLNSKQQADFLRGATGAAGVAVAKRAAKVDSELDFDGLVCSAIKKLAASPTTSGQSSPNDVSFYSRDTFADIIAAARELSAQADELTAIDVMPLIGGVGVPFRAWQGAYPDPWLFEVIEVYPSALLSENDLRQAVLQSGGDKVLQCPGLGRDAPITGVMPLSLIDPTSYETYMRGPLRPIAELQASVSIRGMIARVPYDCLARDAAVLVHLCQKVGPTGSPPEFLARIIADVHATVSQAVNGYANGVFADLVNDLQSADPRPFLSGDRHISGTLKPYTALLCLAELRPALMDAQSRSRILRALYAFEAYRVARRVFSDGNRGSRDAAFSSLLGFDLEKTRIQLTPLFEPDPEPQFDSMAATLLDVDSAIVRAQSLDWVPDPLNPLAILRFALGGDALTEDFASLYAVSDLSFLRFAAAAFAISQANESDRIDTATRKALCPDLDDRAGVVAHLRDLVKGIYQKDYETRLAAKKNEEARIRLQKLISDLLAAPDSYSFLRLLQGIANRSSPGYPELESGLTDLAREVPDRLGKLEIILMARDHSGTPIWANGNVMMGNLDKFESIFKQLDPSGERWQGFLRIKKIFGIYQYRNTQRCNRHKHGNHKPSFFAFGYKSVNEYEKAVGPEEFAKYRALHVNCCKPDHPRTSTKRHKSLKNAANTQ